MFACSPGKDLNSSLQGGKDLIFLLVAIRQNLEENSPISIMQNNLQYVFPGQIVQTCLLTERLRNTINGFH